MNPIRTARIDDAAGIHAVHTRAARISCSVSYSQAQLDGWLGRRTPEGYHPGIRSGEMYVCERGGEIVGFGHAVPGEIVAVFVDPDHQRRGIGRQLLAYGFRIAEAGKEVVCLEATPNAEAFYASAGFTKVDEHFLRRGEVRLRVIGMEKTVATAKAHSPSGIE